MPGQLRANERAPRSRGSKHYCPPLHGCTHQSHMHITQGPLSDLPMQRLLQSWCAGLVLCSVRESSSQNVCGECLRSRLTTSIRAACTPQVLVTPKMRTRLPHLMSPQTERFRLARSQVTRATKKRGRPTFQKRPRRSHHLHPTKLPVPKRALVTPRMCSGCHGYDLLDSSTRALFAATSRA